MGSNTDSNLLFNLTTMDTNAALLSIQTLKGSITQECNDLMTRTSALQVAEDQLNGVLITQSSDLKAQFQATIDNLTGQITHLSEQIPVKDQMITDLNNQIVVLRQQIQDLLNAANTQPV